MSTVPGDRPDSLLPLRRQMDERAALPVLLYFGTGILWLLAGTALGVASSLKFNAPEWLGSIPALTFGRIRPAHLNAVMYGWASLAGAGCLVWLTSRLCLVPVQWRACLLASAALWNAGLVYGVGSILLGYSAGVEWLEFPLPAVALIALAFLLYAASILRTFSLRKVDHVYVSLWYVLASVVWFPLLYVVANLPIYSGVVHGVVNWWYAHNALAVWFTPVGLALAYYFIPKIIGRPIYSYYLSLLGFWTFALFYNWNGVHHLVGGPVPNWLQTISIIASVMMVIPVLTVAVNHHLTTVGNFRMLRTSLALRFTVFGAMSYTAVSFQGSMEALRSVQETLHFTHYTIGHAHLGVYGFLTMILFGAMYYITPRVARWDWPRPAWIEAHFWLTAAGIAVYVYATCWGGFLQGRALNNAAKPFTDVIELTRPYLMLRSVSGILIGAGHLIFAALFAQVLRRTGPRREEVAAP
ncbi:MAG: cbb3-type cytochrome c oxidase subunit I [Bryobacteraceae bacterium]